MCFACIALCLNQTVVRVYCMLSGLCIYRQVRPSTDSWEPWRAPVIPRLGGLSWLDGLRSGYLLVVALCRSGVRTKPGVNMVSPAEARLPRLSKEGRTGPGRKRSRQKSPRSAVVG